jgi:ATP-dependent RNA helicase DHX8/PRP22
LFFHDQSNAIVAAVFLWEQRLAGDHVYTPVTDFDVNEGDLNERIRGLFKLYAEKVLEGEVVKKLERKIENLAVEIGKFTSFFKWPKGVRVYSENKVKQEPHYKFRRIPDLSCLRLTNFIIKLYP